MQQGLVSLVLGISCLPGLVEISPVLKSKKPQGKLKIRDLVQELKLLFNYSALTGVRHAFVV